MKLLSVFVLISALLFSILADETETCNSETCQLPNCYCAQEEAPISGKIPQLVTLSFDDSATKLILENFYQNVLYKRNNPDGCRIGGTFYIPHEYTDYTVVNELFNNGFEIASHSISKNFSSEYWNKATRETIELEMGGQREVIAKFANIPISSIVSSRIPNFQLNGDQTYLGLSDSDFVYDNSWPTYSFRRVFPYTLDFLSDQPCLVGTCPTASIPQFWILPIINWIDQNNGECNKLLACDMQGTADEIFEWMKSNFEKSYNGKRAPVNVLLNYAWFNFVENSYEALEKFLDYLQEQEDVFVVSNKQVIEWMRNPVLADEYSSCRDELPAASCKPINCPLENSQGEEKWMGSCITCPKEYPRPGNPEGKRN